MENPTSIYTTRGAGIGFFVASLVFVFTWSPWALLLVPLGALAGFALSRAPGLRERARRAAAGAPGSRLWQAVRRNLAHPNPLVRFGGLWGAAAVLFLLAWLAGYYLLPEAAFRRAAEAQLESRGLGGVSASLAEEWARIFLNNLLPLVLIVAANLLVRVSGFPLGYVVPLYNTTLYGLFVGTNSFAIPYPERLAPTLAILERAGPYEMTAFVLAAAATACWSFYEVRQLFRTVPERAAGRRRIAPAEREFRGEVALLLLAAAILAGAAYREAAMIVGG